ncbi:MAG: SulP family inorganic anion transporter [Methylococcales bacterium]
MNFAAGARTQMATFITASLLALAVAFFTHWFANIPKTSLAAIILIAIFPLVKLLHIIHTWRYQRSDDVAELATLLRCPRRRPTGHSGGQRSAF